MFEIHSNHLYGDFNGLLFKSISLQTVEKDLFYDLWVHRKKFIGHFTNHLIVLTNHVYRNQTDFINNLNTKHVRFVLRFSLNVFRTPIAIYCP